MKRREFSVHLAGIGLTAAGLAATGTVRAQGGPVEGQHYVRLQTPAPVQLSTDKKIEVLEFFWYECPHCYALDPLLEGWVKKLPADVAFRRVPVGFTARHQLTQKMYYALDDMGRAETLHKRIFNAIHQQNVRLLSEADMVAFVSANGVDGAKFSEAFRSFGVATKCSRAKQLVDAYKIDGVPALGVQGRYYTAASLAGTHERSLAVTDYLIDRVRKAA